MLKYLSQIIFAHNSSHLILLILLAPIRRLLATLTSLSTLKAKGLEMFFKVFIQIKSYEHKKGNTKGLETVEESKVEASVDEDARAGDAESPV